MTQDFAKPSTTRKPGAAKKKAASSKSKRTAPKAKPEAKKPSGATASSAQEVGKKSKAPFYFSLIVLFAAFAYGVYFLQSIPPTHVDESTAAKVTIKQENTTDTQTSTSSSNTKEKRFNFYDILPSTTVTPPKVEEYTYKEKNQSGTLSYIIQTGSFKQLKDAERQKAMIALQGIKSHIKAVRNDRGTVWHRVETEPYTNRSKLNSALDKLVSINIEPLVKKIKKTN